MGFVIDYAVPLCSAPVSDLLRVLTLFISRLGSLGETARRSSEPEQAGDPERGEQDDDQQQPPVAGEEAEDAAHDHASATREGTAHGQFLLEQGLSLGEEVARPRGDPSGHGQ
jgi:hypothetical protein